MATEPVVYTDLTPQDLTVKHLQDHYMSLSPEQQAALQKPGRHGITLPLPDGKRPALNLTKLYLSALKRDSGSYQTQSLVNAAVKASKNSVKDKLGIWSPYLSGGEVKPFDSELEGDTAPAPKAEDKNAATAPVVRKTLGVGRPTKAAPTVMLLGLEISPIDWRREGGVSKGEIDKVKEFYDAALKRNEDWYALATARYNENKTKYQAELAEITAKQADVVKAAEFSEADKLKARLAELQAKYPELQPKPEPAKPPKKAKAEPVKDLAQLRAKFADKGE